MDLVLCIFVNSFDENKLTVIPFLFGDKKKVCIISCRVTILHLLKCMAEHPYHLSLFIFQFKHYQPHSKPENDILEVVKNPERINFNLFSQILKN